jgi:general secretion pathway protein K
MALVLVLWVISLLTVMAGSFALSMRRETAITIGIKNNALALAVAESGLAIAELMLLNPEQNQRWRADGSIYEIIGDDAKVRVRLLSEAGKVDINEADQVLLEALMANTPSDAEQKAKLVGAIIDWRDADDLIHSDGAEKNEYKQAGLSYQPSNKPFQTLEELQLVLGMNEAIFLQLEPLITVYSGQATVSVQQAAKEVLQFIPGLDTSLIDSYMTARMESAINNLAMPSFPASTEVASIVEQPVVFGQANILTLVSEAQLADGASAIISVLIKQADPLAVQNTTVLQSPFQVLKWQQITTNDQSLFDDAMSDLLIKKYAEPELNN